MNKRTIAKVLSANDVGTTGSHQAGMLIPKNPDLLSFFPTLDAAIKNPRVPLPFKDKSGNSWELVFIYYNNHFFGGTRNEYRLTCMTKYIRQEGLKRGDSVLLHREANGAYSISCRQASKSVPVQGALDSGWVSLTRSEEKKNANR